MNNNQQDEHGKLNIKTNTTSRTTRRTQVEQLIRTQLKIQSACRFRRRRVVIVVVAMNVARCSDEDDDYDDLSKRQ